MNQKINQSLIDAYHLGMEIIEDANDKGFENVDNDEIKNAIESIEYAAHNGFSEAQYQLGLIYESGKYGIKPDYKKSFTCFKSAAEQGHWDAAYKVGRMHLIGRGTTKDHCEARRWLELAKHISDAESLLKYIDKRYAVQHRGFNGEDVKSDSYLLLVTKEINNLEKGLSCLRKKKKEEALIFLEESALEDKNPEAQYQLGNIYIKELKTLEKAFDFYEKAALQGHAKAQYEIAKIYLRGGKNLSKSEEDAFYWYMQSAMNGDSSAQLSLFFMYKDGVGVEKNFSKSIRWLRESASQNNKIAQKVLGDIYFNDDILDFHPYKKNEEIALTWYERAAESGDEEAQYRLGWMYENGVGTIKNEMAAIYWYKKSEKLEKSQLRISSLKRQHN